MAQGSFDGAEACDIVGLFLLSQLEKQNLKANLGVFRDDGLGISSATPRQIEAIKKKICQTYRKHGLEITVEANKKIVQFLDVELNLENGSYKPFIKPNDVPLYVNQESNHPPTVTKHIPEAINRRLSNLSSDEKMFKSVAPIYQEALKNSGYNYELNFNPQTSSTANKRSRKRNILWFNPPYSLSVKTNVGGRFLKLIDKHFPKCNPLSKVINRQTVKVSYRTTPNMKNVISTHNSKVINSVKENERPCSCPKNKTCPLQGKCLLRNIVYQATITPTQNQTQPETYVGLTSTTFKERLGNHKKSFNHRRYQQETSLSMRIWELRDEGIEVDLKWKILERARPFSPISGLCNLCTTEKYYLIFEPELGSINKREEINNYCKHKTSILLDKT